jgi:hypothetical protein
MIDLVALQGAIEAHMYVAFDYMDRFGVATHRDMCEPYEIRGGISWCFCPIHQQIHSFKIANMANLVVIPDQTFIPRW